MGLTGNWDGRISRRTLLRTGGSAAAGIEFIGTSISSEGDRRTAPTTYGGDLNNPHILFEDFHRGYVRVTLEPGRWTNEFRVVETVSRSENVRSWTEATFYVNHGEPGAHLLGSAVAAV